MFHCILYHGLCISKAYNHFNPLSSLPGRCLLNSSSRAGNLFLVYGLNSAAQGTQQHRLATRIKRQTRAETGRGGGSGGRGHSGVNSWASASSPGHRHRGPPRPTDSAASAPQMEVAIGRPLRIIFSLLIMMNCGMQVSIRDCGEAIQLRPKTRSLISAEALIMQMTPLSVINLEYKWGPANAALQVIQSTWVNLNCDTAPLEALDAENEPVLSPVLSCVIISGQPSAPATETRLVLACISQPRCECLCAFAAPPDNLGRSRHPSLLPSLSVTKRVLLFPSAISLPHH